MKKIWISFAFILASLMPVSAFFEDTLPIQTTGWAKLNGRLVDIGASKHVDEVWGVNRGGNVYYRNAHHGWKRFKAPRQMVKITVGRDYIWALDSYERIYRKESGDQSPFKRVRGRLTDIDVSANEEVIGVNRYGNTYKWNGKHWTHQHEYDVVPLSKATIDADGEVHGINLSRLVHVNDPLTDGGKHLGTAGEVPLVDITSNYFGEIAAVSSEGIIFIEKPDGSIYELSKPPSSARIVTIAGGNSGYWVLDANGHIYRN